MKEKHHEILKGHLKTLVTEFEMIKLLKYIYLNKSSNMLRFICVFPVV